MSLAEIQSYVTSLGKVEWTQKPIPNNDSAEIEILDLQLHGKNQGGFRAELLEKLTKQFLEHIRQNAEVPISYVVANPLNTSTEKAYRQAGMHFSGFSPDVISGNGSQDCVPVYSLIYDDPLKDSVLRVPKDSAEYAQSLVSGLGLSRKISKNGGGTLIGLRPNNTVYTTEKPLSEFRKFAEGYTFLSGFSRQTSQTAKRLIESQS